MPKDIMKRCKDADIVHVHGMESHTARLRHKWSHILPILPFSSYTRQPSFHLPFLRLDTTTCVPRPHLFRVHATSPRHVRTVVSIVVDLSEASISQLCASLLLRRRHNCVSPQDGRGGVERVWTKGAIRRAASRRVALLRSRTHASSADRSRCRSDTGRTCTCRRRGNVRCVDGVPRGVSLHVLGRVSLHARNAVYAA